MLAMEAPHTDAGGTVAVRPQATRQETMNVPQPQPSDAVDREGADLDGADSGIGMTSVVVMLAVLAVLVVGIFWALPEWFGSQVIEVTIRN